MTRDLIQSYVDAFNAGDEQGLLDTLHPEIEHEINEGGIEIGLAAFGEFRGRMNARYEERLEEVVIFAEGDRGACEFMVAGRYLGTDEGLPEARGQEYRIPAAFFVTVGDGRILRLTSYYNLRRWVGAIS